MARARSIAAIALIIGSLGATAVFAITFGELDGDQHPHVGALLAAVPYPDGPVDIVCSGTLISPTVFVTAAHCVEYVRAAGVPEGAVYVTFDSEYEIGVSMIYPGTYYANPQYGHDQADPHDVAVVVLDAPISDVDPAALPPAGLLDEMKAAGTLKNQSLVAVGYGVVRDDKTGGPHPLYFDGARRFAEGTYNALTKGWLKISMNPAKGDGGTCYGDSGGPHFLGNTTMVVALTVTGDMFCRATDDTYRLDTESARTYLAAFVDLP